MRRAMGWGGAGFFVSCRQEHSWKKFPQRPKGSGTLWVSTTQLPAHGGAVHEAAAGNPAVNDFQGEKKHTIKQVKKITRIILRTSDTN